MGKMLDNLKHYFATTTEEQQQRDWDEVCRMFRDDDTEEIAKEGIEGVNEPLLQPHCVVILYESGDCLVKAFPTDADAYEYVLDWLKEFRKDKYFGKDSTYEIEEADEVNWYINYCDEVEVSIHIRPLTSGLTNKKVYVE